MQIENNSCGVQGVKLRCEALDFGLGKFLSIFCDLGQGEFREATGDHIGNALAGEVYDFSVLTAERENRKKIHQSQLGSTMGLCSFLCVAIFIIFLLHCFFEVHYFLRMTLCVIMARFTKKKAHILDQTTFGGELEGISKASFGFFINWRKPDKRKCFSITFLLPGICLTNDIDTLITHMNNVRQFNCFSTNTSEASFNLILESISA